MDSWQIVGRWEERGKITEILFSALRKKTENSGLLIKERQQIQTTEFLNNVFGMLYKLKYSHRGMGQSYPDGP